MKIIFAQAFALATLAAACAADLPALQPAAKVPIDTPAASPARASVDPTARSSETPMPTELPKGHDYFELRDGFANCAATFREQKRGRVVFMGGSITTMAWRERTMQWLRAKFPDTTFEFINAGIPSLGSVPHAFRLERDVLSRGPVDLFFFEAAVNDTENLPTDPLLGCEGVIRHLRNASPMTDIAQLHFVELPHIEDYRRGKIPAAVEAHEQVAAHYGCASLNLSREVTDRIDAGQLSWEKDFRDLHPSSFGQKLYAKGIARMLEAGFAAADTSPNHAPKPHLLPQEKLDHRSYDRGRLVPVSAARDLNGFAVNPKCEGSRAGFTGVPALEGTAPGSSFALDFHGTAVGLFINSGKDTGILEFSVDDAGFQKVDTYTRWSGDLFLPWAIVLCNDLKPGAHTLHLRLTAEKNPASQGTSLRIVYFLAN
jgi:sialidase-1